MKVKCVKVGMKNAMFTEGKEYDGSLIYDGRLISLIDDAGNERYVLNEDKPVFGIGNEPTPASRRANGPYRFAEFEVSR